MDASIRRQSTSLTRALLDAPQGVDLFQMVRLLGGGAGGTTSRLRAPVRFRAAPEISFPAADIRRAELGDDGAVVLDVNLMGLYGSDAPVPHFLLEAVARGDEAGDRIRAFCDIFNHRLYELLYLAWEKHHGFAQAPDGFLDQCLRALAGRPHRKDDASVVAFAGQLGRRVKNTAGLSGLLSDALAGQPVRIRQFVPSWATLADPSCLGEDLQLGQSTTLGDQVVDVSRKVEIQIGPMPMAEARPLFPDGRTGPELARLIRNYFGPLIDFDICIQIATDGGLSAPLGHADIMIGWSLCLGRAASAVTNVVIPHTHFEGLEEEEKEIADEPPLKDVA